MPKEDESELELDDSDLPVHEEFVKEKKIKRLKKIPRDYIKEI
ncbi:MAG: hypothetical protein ABIF10_06045 [Candidatus Woesearchaeota archaeon]